MSTLLSHAGAAPAAEPAAKRHPFRQSLAALLAVAFVLLIIYAELLVLFIAAVWSVSGVFQLGFAGLIGLTVFVTPAVAWAAWRATSMVIAAERERTDPPA